MILEQTRSQNKQDLAKFLRGRQASVEYSNAAAAKIIKLEEEVAPLQNALTESAQDAAVRDEMKRFMQAQKERWERADNFEIHSQGEEEDDEGVLEREQPYD